MSGGRTIRAESHTVLGEELTWVGDFPWTGALGLGTESGHMLSELPNGDRIGSWRVADGAVNGAAFADDHAAFTSRESILVCRRDESVESGMTPILQRCEGAHGVAATACGTFLFAQGAHGILIASPKRHGCDVQSAQIASAPHNMYRLISLSRAGNAFAVASRDSGVVGFRYDADCGLSMAQSHEIEGKDIVDVCSLNDANHPHSVLAATTECDLILIEDVLRESSPDIVSLPEIRGTVYGVHVWGGHAFVLTESEFLTLPNIVAELRKTDPPEQFTVLAFPTDAFEFYSLENRIFLLDEQGALEFSAPGLARPGAASSALVASPPFSLQELQMTGSRQLHASRSRSQQLVVGGAA